MAREIQAGAVEFAAAVERAWAEGATGWEHLAAAWGTPEAPVPPSAPRCWWDAAPWHGRIEPEEFRAIVAAYVARYGEYTPDVPLREPSLLRAWCKDRGEHAPATESERRDPGRGPRVAA